MPNPRVRRAEPDTDTPDAHSPTDTLLLENELRDRLEWNNWMHACKAARIGDTAADLVAFSRARIAEGHRRPRGLPEACYPPGRARPAVAWLDQLSPAARVDLIAGGPPSGWKYDKDA